MTDRKVGTDPIEPPVVDKKREVVRTLVESAVDLFPGGSIVTGVLRVSHPPKSERDRESWREAISDRTNEHAARLDQHDELLAPTEVLGDTAAQVVAILAHDCPDGLGHRFYDLPHLCALLTDRDKQAVEDAACELESLGLLKIRRFIGGRWHATLTSYFYEQVDHQLMGWNTAEDAATIARIMLAEDTGHAPDLHKKTGWSKRRFNPAFRFLLPLFPDGRIRKVIQPDYPSLGIALAPEDKAALRRYVSRADGGSAR